MEKLKNFIKYHYHRLCNKKGEEIGWEKDNEPSEDKLRKVLDYKPDVIFEEPKQ